MSGHHEAVGTEAAGRRPRTVTEVRIDHERILAECVRQRATAADMREQARRLVEESRRMVLCHSRTLWSP